MMKENEKTITPVENIGIETANEISKGRFNNSQDDRHANALLEALLDMIAINKTNIAIVKKESDTNAYVAKSCSDAEKAYIHSLLQEKERQGITPEELSNLNNHLEAALIRINDQAQETRQQIINSPYRDSFNWKSATFWGIFIVSGVFLLNEIVSKKAA